MTSVFTIGGIALKVLKLISWTPLMNGKFAVQFNEITSLKCSSNNSVINLICLILYRTGYGGEFLGVGGTWNLNEEKNPDAEIVASGVLVGFFIYTAVVLISYCFGTTEQKKTLVEIIMNFVGMFMFIAIGGTALHYWHGYLPEHKYINTATERQVGLALGSLCVLEGAAYLMDTLLSIYAFAQSEYMD